MLVAAMPVPLATMVSGHELTPATAMMEYVDHTRAGCMPGSVVLGGWPKLAYGEMGMGPVPASLNALVTLGVDMNVLADMIDDLFRLDSASPPMLLRDGETRASRALAPEVRPALRAARPARCPD